MAAAKSISNKTVLTRTKTPGDYTIVGNPGLYVRVGARSKIFIAKPTNPETGKRATVRYGDFAADLDWDEAIERHNQLKAELKKLTAKVKAGTAMPGEGDRTIERIVKGEEVALQAKSDPRFIGKTYMDLKDAYLSYATDGKKRPDAILDICDRFLEPYLAHNHGTENRPKYRALNSFTTAELYAELMRIKADNGHDPARKSLVYFNGLYKWGVISGNLDNNPAAGISRDALNIKTGSNDRRLYGEELSVLFDGLQASQMSEVTKCGILLLLLTGARSGELTEADWDSVYFDDNVWYLEDSKNGAEHYFYMTPQIKELFERLYKETANTGLVLGGLNEKTMTRAFSRLQKPNGRGEIRLAFPAGYCNLHGLRHTFVSLLTELKIDRDVRKRLTNHKDGDAHEIYENAELRAECEEAMRVYCDAVLNPVNHKRFEAIPAPKRRKK